MHRAWSVICESLANDNVTHMSITVPISSVTRVTKRWVMLPQMSVTLLTKGSRGSHCESFAACCTNCQHCSTCPIKTYVSQLGDSHAHQNHKSFISLVTEECVILHKLSVTDMTEGYVNVPCFVNEVGDNGWPCPGEVGCVIQLISALPTMKAVFWLHTLLSFCLVELYKLLILFLSCTANPCDVISYSSIHSSFLPLQKQPQIIKKKVIHEKVWH